MYFVFNADEELKFAGLQVSPFEGLYLKKKVKSRRSEG